MAVPSAALSSMKTINLPRLLLSLSLAAGPLAAAPLSQPANVHTQPDAAAPVIQTLPAGTEPFVAVGVEPPAGWAAIALPGAHEVYVRTADLLKDLSPRPGANYYLLQKNLEVPVAVVEQGDIAQLLSIQGKHYKYNLSKALIGFIPAPVFPPAPAFLTTTPPAAPIATPPAATRPPEPARDLATAPPTGSPVPPAPKPAATAGAELPRLFEGTLSSTRSPLHPRRPYDFELLDSNGVRYAYLDFTSLPPTEQPGRFVGSVVVIYGIAKPVSGIADMVIEAETVRSR